MTLLHKSSDTYKSIAKYLDDSLGIQPRYISYAGTHTSEGLTPIVHYDIVLTTHYESRKGFTVSRTIRATVYWNNETEPPTITRMDVTA